MFRLDARLLWPQGLANWSGKIYESWRNHLADPLDNAEEKFSKEFLRYYIIGSECIVGSLLENQSEEPIPENLRLRLEQDLAELDYVQHGLPVDLQLRIHSLRFYFFCLVDNEDDVLYESGQITHIYNEHPGMIVFNSIPQYQIASRKYLDEYSSGINRNKELEELNQYYENKRYADIVELLLKTLESTCVTPGKETSRTPDKETQIDILIESLFHVDMYVKCLKWCTYALCSTFAKMIVDSETGDSKKLTPHCWMVIDSYLQTIESCLLNTEKHDFAETTFDTGSKLATVLIQILCIQIDQVSSSEMGFDQNLPWIILHKLIVWAESYVVMDLNKSWDQDEMKGSMSLLCSAHDYLGQKSCCTNQKGSLLNYTLDVFLPILLNEDKPCYADQIKSNLDQAIYCLFSHPSKKSRVRHLGDHGVSQVALTWERAVKLYQYIKPDKIPEHDDVKLLSISLDSESFLRRLFALIPLEVGIEKRREVAKLFVLGKKDKMKLKNLKKLPADLKDVLYLLADYCFKNSKDLDRAIDFFTLDISFNPERYDSWAALALAQASKMDQRLNSCKKLIPTKMLENTIAVETCFKKCLEMNDGNSNLWIEYGNFSYNVHSYISRTLQNNSEEMSLEDFEVLNSKKESLLSTALENYKQTLRIFEKDGIDENDVDERWLIHYMIGKIHEKTNSSIITSLNCYITSMNCLASNGAILPRKVNYNSPQSMSLETLEIYYRIHATILKHLVNQEAKLDLETREALYEIMKTVQLSKVYNTNAQENHTVRFSMKRKIEVSTAVEPVDKVPRSDESSTSIMRDVIEVMDTMIDEVDFCTDTSKHEVSKLTKLALSGLEDVAFHFFHHFKALYRLAHYHYNSDKVKNLGKVQKLLLAGANERNVLCPGLFFGRKPNQIFNDVWRIPISEIDRPGSFASHCSKSLMLLIDVLKSLGDLNTLTDIALQLRKPPTEENKFVHESDRLEVGTMANTYLFNSIKIMVNNVSVEKETLKPTVMLEIFKIYQKIQKQWPGKEKEMLTHLKELYSKIKGRTDKDKITNEEVIKFCNLETGRQRSNQSSRNQGISSPYAAQAYKPTTVVSQASPAPAYVEMNISKQAQISADIVKITTFQETSALSLPNMTNDIIAAQSNFKYSDSPRLVNGLFQTLKSLNQAQLRKLNFDLVKLDVISKFAFKIGLVASSVNDYAAKIRQIMNGTKPVVAKPTVTKPFATKPIITKPSVTQKKPVFTPATKTSGATNAQKINLGRPNQFKPNKMTPAQRNLKNFQMLLQQQQGSPVEAAKTMMASNNLTITSGIQKKAQTPQTTSSVSKPSAQIAAKPSIQTISPSVQVKSRFTSGIQAKSNLETVQRPGPSLSGQPSSPGTLKKLLPAGITLTMEKKAQVSPLNCIFNCIKQGWGAGAWCFWLLGAGAA